MPVAPDDRLGPYEIVALVGRGDDTILHRQVALKGDWLERAHTLRDSQPESTRRIRV